MPGFALNLPQRSPLTQPLEDSFALPRRQFVHGRAFARRDRVLLAGRGRFSGNEALMKVGFLGLGAMGTAMAANVLKAGNELHVWNRTASAANALVEAGATLANEPKAVAGCDVILAMFADDDAFRGSVFASGLLDALDARTTFVNMATVSVALARETTERFAARGVHYVSAPVLGRPDAAAAAKLNILAAGKPDAIARVQPLFDVMGQKTWPFGDDPPLANAAKIACNFMIVSSLEMMSEAFALARGNGVDPRALFDIFSNTLFAAPVFKNYGAQILDERFDPPGFKLRLGLKDVRLALQAGEGANTPLPFASVLRDVMLEAIAAGDGEKDWAALANVARRRSGTLERTPA
jgi:3-hydroxyisobutyrate dehydrogenase-like beta-hydroxyacid dehydrogenase